MKLIVITSFLIIMNYALKAQFNEIGTSGNIHFNDKIAIGYSQNLSNMNYSLFVANGIITEEIKVNIIENWPDYVFVPDYKLISLDSLELYIMAHKHLPEMPAENEIKRDGLDISKIQSALLKRIEDLTLYLISQDKALSQLENEIENILK